MKLTLAVIVISSLLVSGCASLNTAMVNPDSGRTENCSAVGFGIIGSLVAVGMHSDCEERLKKAGFIPSKDYEATKGTPIAAKQ